MLVHKYYCRPCDEASEALALEEIARYVGARNRLLTLRRKWQRITEDIILPEYRQLAAELRATPRTGRKPSKERSDRAELRAADTRAAYAEFIGAGGSYATWWLVEAAAKKAKHPLRDPLAGRAGMLPQWLTWGGSILHYAGTQWSVHPRHLRVRPVPEQARIAQAWLQRERKTTSLMRRPRYQWFLVLVLDDVSARMHPVPQQRTAAGLDIAWRQDDDTLRVAYVADDAGAHRAIRMSAAQYAALQHAESLVALADQEANLLRARFGVPANTSHRRLCELAGIAATSMGPFRKYDGPPPPTHAESSNAELAEHLVHLMQWAHGARRHALASRDALYLQEAHALLARNHTIYVEDMKGAPGLVQKRSTRQKKSEVDNKGGVARDQRQMAAPFTFLRMLQREAGKFGTEVVAVAPEYTSRVCADCGYDLGKSSKRERRCGGCERVWDLDHLAAVNIRVWGTARKPTPEAAQ
jgi:hypothetical protein